MSLVGTKQPANLTRADTDITGRHVSVGTDVMAELCKESAFRVQNMIPCKSHTSHESLAELADLTVALALGLEISSTLTTTDLH